MTVTKYYVIRQQKTKQVFSYDPSGQEIQDQGHGRNGSSTEGSRSLSGVSFRKTSNSTTHAHQDTAIYLFMHNVPDTFVKTYPLP